MSQYNRELGIKITTPTILQSLASTFASDDMLGAAL